MVIAQKKVIGKLCEEIEKLKVRLNADSQTSSKPPSTDLLKKSEKGKKEEKQAESVKRKAGGQPGHKGKTRKGFGRVDRYELLKPETCINCGGKEFTGKAVKVELQQVAQLVERPIEIVEYERHHCQCSRCGGVTAASWSQQMIPAQELGVKLQGFLCWLGNYGNLSYGKQQELLWELGEIEISQGTLVATNERVYDAIAPSVESLQEWIQQTQPNLHIDETPWPVVGVKEWLWVLAGERFCLFHSGDTRGRKELEGVLGSSYGGVIISDDFSVYNSYPARGQQKCLAHLLRHFKRLFKTKGKHNQDIAQVFLGLISESFEQHQLWRQTQDETQYRHWGMEFRERVRRQVAHWLSCAGHEAGKLLRSLTDKAHQWWYFLDHPEVPPDNNLAERCLRTAVTKRKVCGGSRSLSRFRSTAYLLSIIQSCRLQKRSVIRFFEKALQAHVGVSFIPSLIPQSTT